MSLPNMRHLAKQCVLRARSLLALGDENSLRYACLELRFAIEYITYEQVQAYRKELAWDVLKKWTPKQLISEMLEVDPTADQTVSIAFGIEPSDRVAPPPEEMRSLGSDQRFSLRWANKNHNALGNFLHAPTIDKLETGEAPTTADMLKKVTEVATKCDAILESRIWGINFGVFLDFTCQYCQTQIHKREGSFTSEQGVACPKCSAVYDWRSSEGGKGLASPRRVEYKCKLCGKVNYIPVHMIEVGIVIICDFCNSKAKVGFAVTEVQSAPDRQEQ